MMTLGLLGAAYKGGRASLKSTLAHLLIEPSDAKAACGQRADHLVDEQAYESYELQYRPTCPRCAKRWDKLNGVRYYTVIQEFCP